MWTEIEYRQAIECCKFQFPIAVMFMFKIGNVSFNPVFNCFVVHGRYTFHSVFPEIVTIAVYPTLIAFLTYCNHWEMYFPIHPSHRAL